MDFMRNARWVLKGHKMPDPVGSTFASMVSRESMQIAFTYAALNRLDVFAADTRNAYLQLPHLRGTTLFVVPSLGLKMWDVWN